MYTNTLEETQYKQLYNQKLSHVLMISISSHPYQGVCFPPLFHSLLLTFLQYCCRHNTHRCCHSACTTANHVTMNTTVNSNHTHSIKQNITIRMAIANGTCVSFCNQPKAHFGLPWVCPWDNHISHMDEKRIQSLSNASQHVPIYLQPFPSNSTHKFKSSPF